MSTGQEMDYYPPRAYIDTPMFNLADENGWVRIWGWCLLGKRRQPQSAEITVNGRRKAVVPFSHDRADVLKAFPQYKVGDKVGFEYYMDAPSERKLDVVVTACDCDGVTYSFSKVLWVLPPITYKENRGLEDRLKKTGFLLKYPKVVWVEVTTACILSCIMCYPTRRNRKEDYLDKRVFDRFSKILPHAEQINLYGTGEPMLHPDYPYFVGKSRDLNPTAHISVTTNLNLLPEKVINCFIGDAFSSITVSMDAATKGTYEKIRVNGKWENMIKNIERIEELKVQSRLKYPLMNFAYVVQRDNIAELPDFIALVNDISSPSLIVLQHVVNYPELSVDYSEHIDVIRETLDVSKKFGNVLTGSGLFKMIKAVGEGVRGCFAAVVKDSIPYCFDPVQTLILDVNGSVRTCCPNGTHFGNVLEEDIEAIYHGFKYNLFRELMLSAPKITECIDCIREIQVAGSVIPRGEI